MTKQVDPKIYTLPVCTVLKKKDSDRLTLVINTKSRTIMKDALAAIKKIERILIQATTWLTKASNAIILHDIQFR